MDKLISSNKNTTENLDYINTTTDDFANHWGDW